MINISFLIILFISIQCREYDSIKVIRGIIIASFDDLSINFGINGSNDYFYNFTSQNILYKFGNVYSNDDKKEFAIYNDCIRIIFNLEIGEYNPRLFDYSSNDVQYSEKIHVDLQFKYMKFFKEYPDFSFGFLYKIGDLDNDISIYYENMDKMNSFKYLLYDDINEIYNNDTLNNFIKLKIIENLEKEIKKMLVYYPECDSLVYLNSIISYFRKQEIHLDYRIYQVGNLDLIINSCYISEFDEKEIIKENKTIIFKDINFTMTIASYLDDPEDYEEQELEITNKTVYLDYISINEGYQIEYGKVDKESELYLDVLKIVINSIEETKK